MQIPSPEPSWLGLVHTTTQPPLGKAVRLENLWFPVVYVLTMLSTLAGTPLAPNRRQ